MLHKARWLILVFLLGTIVPAGANFCQTYLVVQLANNPSVESTWLSLSVPRLIETDKSALQKKQATQESTEEPVQENLLGAAIRFSPDQTANAFGVNSTTNWSTIKFTAPEEPVAPTPEEQPARNEQE